MNENEAKLISMRYFKRDQCDKILGGVQPKGDLMERGLPAFQILPDTE